VGVVLAVLVAVVASAAWVAVSREGPEVFRHEVHEVRAGPFSVHVHFSGTLAPARTVAVAAPFDGTIASLEALPGDLVTEGAVLMVLDTSDILIKLRDAEGAWLEARAKVLALRNWDTAPEMLTAKRALRAAEAAVEDAATEEAQTLQLLKAGVIPAQEYQDARRQRAATQRELDGARVALEQIRLQSASEVVQVAELREENARAIFEDLRLRAGRKALAAPLSGVVHRAVRTGERAGEDLGVGSRVAHGETLYTLSSSDAFVVTGHVDERDVNAVRVGHPVEVQAEALVGGRTGRVVRLANHAEPGAAVPKFEIMVALDPPRDGPEPLKMGMNVMASVLVYHRDAALTVPTSALLPDGTVLVPNAKGVERRTVTIGHSGPGSTEVLSGLAEGDVIGVTPPP